MKGELMTEPDPKVVLRQLRDEMEHLYTEALVWSRRAEIANRKYRAALLVAYPDAMNVVAGGA